MWTAASAGANLGLWSVRYLSKVSTERCKSSASGNLGVHLTITRRFDPPCKPRWGGFPLSDAVSGSFIAVDDGKNTPSPVLPNRERMDSAGVVNASSKTAGELNCSWLPFSLDIDESSVVVGAGPPSRVIQPSCGTDRRPATDSGYNAMTLAGLRCSSRNVSMAESNLEARNSETAFNARIRVRLVT